MSDDGGDEEEDPEEEPTRSSTRRSIVSLFDSVCAQFGDDDAIISVGSSDDHQGSDSDSSSTTALSYSELQHASRALARQLHHRYRPDLVLLDLRRAAAAELVAVLACARCRVPFVPVDAVTDLHHPNVGSGSRRRLDRIVDTLQLTRSHRGDPLRLVAVVRTASGGGDGDPVAAPFVEAGVHNVVCVNEAGDLLEPMSVPESLPDVGDVRPDAPGDDHLYVLFTSGTSGPFPRAVVGSHLATVGRLEWFAAEFPSLRDTVVVRRTPLTFVDGVTELLEAVLFPPARLLSFAPGLLAERGVGAILHQTSPCITRVTLLPSQLSQLLLYCSSMPDEKPVQHKLELVIVSGEMCPERLLADFRRVFPDVTLLNLYGQTECTGDSTWANLTEQPDPVIDHVVSVGRPLPGVRIETTAAAGGAGELVVSGSCMSHGYYDRSKLMKQQQQTVKPFSSFRTGDIGFCRNGYWYVQGRVDDVIKIDGVLTSAAEVEAAFRQTYSDVSACVAVHVGQAVYVVVEEERGESADGITGSFSRKHMREEAGIPWNLIPKQVFVVPAFPQTSGGAGKIQRAAIRDLVKERLSAQQQQQQASGKEDGERASVDPLWSTLSAVLTLPLSKINEDSSFVELGGNSALAVTFLYQAKQAGLLRQETLTAGDILLTESVQELRLVLSGERKPKRPKTEESATIMGMPSFSPRPIEQIDNDHIAIQFAACVDAAPLVVKGEICVACQGGVIQRIVRDESAASYKVATSDHLKGWKVQAEILDLGDTLVVCGYDPKDQTGIAVAVSLDLSTIKWKRKLNGMIKSKPVHVGTSVYVLAGKQLHLLGCRDGAEQASYTLPCSTESRPAVMQRRGSPAIVYASSDWDVGFVIVEDGGKSQTTVSEATCPVYADLLKVDDTRIIAADISGCLHELTIDPLTVKTTRVANHPIFSGPVKMTNDPFSGKYEGNIVFGCHDGVVRCVSANDFSVELWTFDTKGVVYAPVCLLEDSEVLVCTTTGDVLIIREGEEQWRYRVGGEVWSKPVVCDFAPEYGNPSKVCFGARDSKLHILMIP